MVLGQIALLRLLAIFEEIVTPLLKIWTLYWFSRDSLRNNCWKVKLFDHGLFRRYGSMALKYQITVLDNIHGVWSVCRWNRIVYE